MHELDKLLDSWYIKIFIAAISTLFSPFQVSLLVLCIMLIIDTVIGSLCAMKIHAFSSRRLRKGLDKIIMYFLCILVVRLLEIGIQSIIVTTRLTELIISYLIITESISALENITLLGAPLPTKFIDIILSHAKIRTFKNIFLDANKKSYAEEISDMIRYNVASYKSQELRKLMEIKLKEWINFISLLDRELNESKIYSKDLLLHKVLFLINATVSKACDYWDAEDISKSFMADFKKLHKLRADQYFLEVKTICESDDSLKKKKTLIIEKLIVVLYKTLSDVQKLQ